MIQSCSAFLSLSSLPLCVCVYVYVCVCVCVCVYVWELIFHVSLCVEWVAVVHHRCTVEAHTEHTECSGFHQTHTQTRAHTHTHTQRQKHINAKPQTHTYMQCTHTQSQTA